MKNREMAHSLSLKTPYRALLCFLGAASLTACVVPATDMDPSESTGPYCYKQDYTQPDTGVQKLDLLFMTDTSGSLDDERSQIAQGIDSFVAHLPQDGDFRIGVMLGHGSKSNYTGKLYQSTRTEPYVLDSKALPMNTLRTHLKNKLTHVADDSYSDGGEEGVYSLNRALDADRLSLSRTQGFFRTDAALAVVFISDENDICAVYPSGIIPVPDPEGMEASAKIRDCGNITSAGVLNRLKALQGDLPLVVAGIVYTDARTVPHIGENEVGYGYLDLIGLAHGITMDIGMALFTQGLSDLGQFTAQKMKIKTDFILDRSGIEPTTLAAQVDGKTVGFDYCEERNEITLTDGGQSRSSVEINYCLKHEVLPSPTPSVSPSASPSPSPSASTSPSPTPSPSVSPSPEPSPSASPSPEPSVSPSPSSSPSPAPTCTGISCGVFGV